MEESFLEFSRRIRKVHKPRYYKVRNSLGVYDAFKYYRKNKPKDKKYVLKETQYFSLVRKINNILGEHLIKGEDVELPLRMGSLMLMKKDRYVRLDENGKLKTNLPIDWMKTLKLWYEDENARKNKTFVRIEESEIFYIIYNKGNYNNRSYYEFIFNRDLKGRLKRSIKNKRTDTIHSNTRKYYVE